MYLAQGASSFICNQSSLLYERVTLLALKKIAQRKQQDKALKRSIMSMHLQNNVHHEIVL